MTKRQQDFVVVTGVWPGERGGPQDLKAVMVSARTYDHASEVARKLGHADQYDTYEGRKVWLVWAASQMVDARCMAPELVTDCIRTNGITTVRAFVEACATLDFDGVYHLFEDTISQELRDAIYDFADEDSPEPARSAFEVLGSMYGVDRLANW